MKMAKIVWVVDCNKLLSAPFRTDFEAAFVNSVSCVIQCAPIKYVSVLKVGISCGKQRKLIQSWSQWHSEVEGLISTTES